MPSDHLLRRIDVAARVVLVDLHEELTPYYSDTGRPSIDPESVRNGFATEVTSM